MEANGKRPRRDASAAAAAADMYAVQVHAQWWNPATKPQVEALQSSVVEGVDGATSAWVADERNRALGQELSLDEEKTHADLVREGRLRGFAARKRFDVYTQRHACHVSKEVVQIRWVLTWKMADGGAVLRRAWRRKVSRIPIYGRAFWVPQSSIISSSGYLNRRH